MLAPDPEGPGEVLLGEGEAVSWVTEIPVTAVPVGQAPPKARTCAAIVPMQEKEEEGRSYRVHSSCCCSKTLKT